MRSHYSRCLNMCLNPRISPKITQLLTHKNVFFLSHKISPSYTISLLENHAQRLKYELQSWYLRLAPPSSWSKSHCKRRLTSETLRVGFKIALEICRARCLVVRGDTQCPTSEHAQMKFETTHNNYPPCL